MIITDAMVQETAKILAAVFYRHDEDDGKTYVKTATVILVSAAPEIRRAAMGEAAKIADDEDEEFAYSGQYDNWAARTDALRLCATAIRALAEKDITS